MVLENGRKMHAFSWTEFSIDDYLINRVEEMSRSDNQPIVINCYHIFEWDPVVPIPDNDEDENMISDTMEQVAYDVHV